MVSVFSSLNSRTAEQQNSRTAEQQNSTSSCFKNSKKQSKRRRLLLSRRRCVSEQEETFFKRSTASETHRCLFQTHGFLKEDTESFMLFFLFCSSFLKPHLARIRRKNSLKHYQFLFIFFVLKVLSLRHNYKKDNKIVMIFRWLV